MIQSMRTEVTRHSKTELYNAIGPAIHTSGTAKNIPTSAEAPWRSSHGCARAHDVARTRTPNNAKHTFTRLSRARVTSSDTSGHAALIIRNTRIMAKAATTTPTAIKTKTD